MEQIVKRDGEFFYGNRVCVNADDAYIRFRSDYNNSIGSRAYHRLNRLGSRTSRVRDDGFVFKDDRSIRYDEHHRIPVSLMGLVCGSYCKMLGAWDCPDFLDEESFWDWYELVFANGSKAVRQTRNKAYGRTGKRLKTRYR